MSESSERVIYGYRITGGPMEGAEVWPYSIDEDDDWLPFNESPHVPQINLRAEDPAQKIRDALAAAGVSGVPIMRVVHIVWGDVTDV